MISWGSDAVNGQLVPRTPASAIYPLTFSAEYTGPGVWPKQGTYQVPPTIPAVYQRNVGAPGAFGNAASGVVGGGPTVEDEKGNPFHPTKGIIVFAFLFLVVSLFGLQYIHWR